MDLQESFEALDSRAPDTYAQAVEAYCDGILRLCGLSPQNEAFLRTYDLSGSIAHYCDRESAVMGQDSPRRPR